MARVSNGMIPSPGGSPTAHRDQVPDKFRKELHKNIVDNSARFKYQIADNRIFTIGDRTWSCDT